MSERSNTALVDIPSYPNAAKLIEAEAGRMFLHLEDKSNIEVAYLFGLDRYLKSEGSMRSGVTRAYNLVLDDPAHYDILPEKAAFIHGIVTSRILKKKDPETIREQEELAKMDIGALMLSTRDIAAKLVRRKLDYLNEHPQALRDEKLKDLGWLLGVLFDKGQIIQGAATEHIAVMSNLPEHIDPDEALKAIMQMREQFNSR